MPDEADMTGPTAPMLCDDMAEMPTQAGATSNRHLLDMLAIMHGDGGHYVDRHGIDKAVADAITRWYDILVKSEVVAVAVPEGWIPIKLAPLDTPGILWGEGWPRAYEGCVKGMHGKEGFLTEDILPCVPPATHWRPPITLAEAPEVKHSVAAAVPEVPEGFKLVAVKNFDALMYWLDRCEDKGHLENCADLIEPWEAFEYRYVEAVPGGER